jgi:hypothetical protein
MYRPEVGDGADIWVGGLSGDERERYIAEPTVKFNARRPDIMLT